MGDPFDERSLPPTMRLTPRPQSKGLPVPPVLPLVAVLCILGGLALGYGLASKPGPSAPPVRSSEPSPIAFSSATLQSDPTAGPIALPAATPEIPPPDGLSLAQALEALRVSFGPPDGVISARVGHYPAVSDGWVWLIEVRYSAVDCADGADPPLSCRWITTTELVILDFKTGEFLEDRIPSG